MACLDTTLLVDLLRSNPERKRRALDKVKALAVRGEAIVTTRINLAELYVGINLSDDPHGDFLRVHRVLDHVDAVLEFNDSAAQAFGEFSAYLRRQGRPAGDMDVLIAAVAATSGHTLVTSNPAHFSKIPYLRVESY